MRGVRVINIGDSLTHQLVETWRVCRVPFSRRLLDPSLRIRPAADGRAAQFGGAADPAIDAPLRHRRDPLQNAGERGASRRRGRSPTATPTKERGGPPVQGDRPGERVRAPDRAAAGGGGASARTRRRARMPSARRGSVPTPTSNARTGPRSSSSSRSGLGASSPGPSRSTTRAWPSAAWPSGTRRATSRRTFAASSLSLLCSVGIRTPRSRRSSLRAEPTAEPDPSTLSTRQTTAGTRRASCRSGGRSSARARSRRTRRSARSGSSGTRPSARAWPWSTTASRTSRASRVSRASCWFLCLRPSGAVPSPPGVDLSA